MLRLLIILVGILLITGCVGEDPLTKPAYTIDDIPNPDEFIPVEQLPELIVEEPPEYPLWAHENDITASVTIQAYVNKYGYVQKAQAIECSEPGWGFEEAVVQAAYRCQYQPAIQNGQPVGVWVAYKVNMEL